MATYIALIHKDGDSDYGVSFPDLPGCVTAGSTLDEALDMAGEALALHLRGIQEDGEAIPDPSSLEAVRGQPEAADALAVASVKAPAGTAKSVRINITVPEDVLAEVDAYAEASGYSRSGFLVMAAKKAIRAA
jgi:predicted RNase H-like HicB family nuclease